MFYTKFYPRFFIIIIIINHAYVVGYCIKEPDEFNALFLIMYMYICMHYEYMYKKLSVRWFGLKLKEIGYRYFGMFNINILFVYSKKKKKMRERKREEKKIVRPFIDSHRSFPMLRKSTRK